MPRHIKKKTAASTAPKRTTKKKATRRRKPKTEPSEELKGADRKTISNQRGGYANKGVYALTEAELTPSMLEGVDLSGTYPPGEIPDIVMYGRRLQVLSLMVNGEPTFNIIEFCKRAFTMSATQTKFIVASIRTQWRQDVEEQTSYARVETITRLRRDLSGMRSALKKPWSAIAKHEDLLSKIEGTQQAVKVNVFDGAEVMRDSLAASLGSMSEEEMEEFVTTGYESGMERILPPPAP